MHAKTQARRRRSPIIADNCSNSGYIILYELNMQTRFSDMTQRRLRLDIYMTGVSNW
jgi:hypothetical protein